MTKKSHRLYRIRFRFNFDDGSLSHYVFEQLLRCAALRVTVIQKPNKINDSAGLEKVL